MLGHVFDDLPLRLQQIHSSDGPQLWKGSARVQRGKGLLALVLVTLFGFPQSADDVPVRVGRLSADGVELWTRDFGGKTFSTTQSLGQGSESHLLIERFGAVSIALALVKEGDRLFFIPRGWRIFGLPLPAFLLPSGRSYETETDGKFCFNVEISVPLIGLVVAYRGLLTPVVTGNVPSANRSLV
ncbi:MAG TPA: DUF4166 domain-containing protein [Ensifer sp.]|nr:DUF4166 domain-containing protein [Ensifer sp.]